MSWSTRSAISGRPLARLNVRARISSGRARLRGDEVGDPPREDGGLAGAGAGDDEERPSPWNDRLRWVSFSPSRMRVLGGGRDGFRRRWLGTGPRCSPPDHNRRPGVPSPAVSLAQGPSHRLVSGRWLRQAYQRAWSRRAPPGSGRRAARRPRGPVIGSHRLAVERVVHDAGPGQPAQEVGRAPRRPSIAGHEVLVDDGPAEPPSVIRAIDSSVKSPSQGRAAST